VCTNPLQYTNSSNVSPIVKKGRARRDGKSLVLGKARVVSYEDLEVARAKRAEKEADKAARSSRGRKRKGMQGSAEGSAQAETQEPASTAIHVAPRKALFSAYIGALAFSNSDRQPKDTCIVSVA
jgi:hypothetical protein